MKPLEGHPFYPWEGAPPAPGLVAPLLSAPQLAPRDLRPARRGRRGAAMALRWRRRGWRRQRARGQGEGVGWFKVGWG